MNRRQFVAAAAASPFALRASLAAAARAPVALVTCDAEARLAVVDLSSYRVVGSIETLADPRSIERVGGRALVCHTALGALSVVAGRRVLHVVRGLTEPRYAAAHPDGVHAFVTDSGRSAVWAVDVVRGRLLGHVRLPGWARHLTIDHSGERLWIGLGSVSSRLAVVSTAELRHTGTMTPAFGMHDVGLAPDGTLWVTAGGSRELLVGGRRQQADPAPQHVTFAQGHAYVTSGDAGTLNTHALDGRILRSTPVPVGSYNVQAGAGRIVTASLEHGTLAVLDTAGALLATVRVAGSCHDACVLVA